MDSAIDRLRTALADKYRLDREIGQGGMATVYLAQDLKHDRQVALKVLRPELAATLGPARFFREIQVAARLQHPHILPLHDSGEAGGFLYYVMPYVDGESLRERLARVGELPIHDAVKILMEVVDALAYAHGQGVVHRDIKPDNVMLSGRHALVTDFGVAKAVSEATGKNQLTTAGVALGTPSYMAPEQAAADPHLDHRVDIYAVGAMAYELLAGRPPFVGMTPQQVLAAHVTQTPEPVSRYRAAVTPALEGVIMRCLAKRAADRWQTAEELLQNLEPLATPSGGMTPTHTQPVKGFTGASAAVGRRGMLVGGAAILLVVAALGWLALRGGTTKLIEADRVQVTFTGNAGHPGLSPDGQRLAFSSRQCTAEGYCTFDVQVQDVGGAGVSTILHGWASIWNIRWSGDARYLLVDGYEGPKGRWGPFSVPSLGGSTARWLGCCTAHMGSGDTAIVTRAVGGDTLDWVLQVPLADGIARDSFHTTHQKGNMVLAWPLNTEGRLLLVHPSAAGQVRLNTVESDGRPIDSLALDDPHFQGARAETVNGGRDIVIPYTRSSSVGDYNLLRFKVGANGEISPHADTLLRGLTGWFSTEPNGMLANATGTPSYEVWLLSGTGGGGMRFTQRRMAAATAPLGGAIDAAGTHVALWRRVIQGGTALTQISIISADSGTETPFGAPRDISDYAWTKDGRALAVGVEVGDTIVISEQVVGRGRTQVLTTFPKGEFQSLETLPGGGVMIQAQNFHDLHFRGIPGRADTVYSIPESEGNIIAVAPSPDGKALVTIGWDRGTDSIIVRRVALPSMHATKLWTVYADGAQVPTWLRDGTIIVPIKENASTLVWYRIPAAGGRPVRLGTPPRATDATFRLSQDGKRAIARINTSSPDVYLIRNFSDLLRH